MEHLGQEDVGEGRGGRGFDDDGVAGHQRRRDLPGVERDRKVKWEDRRADADGLLASFHLNDAVTVTGVGDRAGDLPAVSGVVIKGADQALELALRLAVDFALLAGQQACQVVPARFGKADELLQHSTAPALVSTPACSRRYLTV